MASVITMSVQLPCYGHPGLYKDGKLLVTSYTCAAVEPLLLLGYTATRLLLCNMAEYLSDVEVSDDDL